MSLWNIWRSVSSAGHFASVSHCIAHAPPSSFYSICKLEVLTLILQFCCAHMIIYSNSLEAVSVEDGVRRHAYSPHTLRSCSARPQLRAVGHLAGPSMQMEWGLYCRSFLWFSRLHRDLNQHPSFPVTTLLLWPLGHSWPFISLLPLFFTHFLSLFPRPALSFLQSNTFFTTILYSLYVTRKWWFKLRNSNWVSTY